MANYSFPQDYLQINDLYRWDSRLERSVEYQPEAHQGKTRIQARESVETELLDAETDAGKPLKVLRAKVNLGIRVVYLEQVDAEPVALHAVEATFAVEYLMVREPSEEQLAGFCQWNCIHNVWPFWRQYVYDTLKSASLPVVSVPFFHHGGRSKKPKTVKLAKKKPEK